MPNSSVRLHMKFLYHSTTTLCLFAISTVGAAAPMLWDIQLDAFGRVFKPHLQCSGSTPTMSEIECSNFKARALKRFQLEWVADSYWRNGKFIPNPVADRRVNSELSK